MGLRIEQLEKGGIYVDPLSGLLLRVMAVITGAGGRPQARCRYYNQVTGRYAWVTMYDGELVELTTTTEPCR